MIAPHQLKGVNPMPNPNLSIEKTLSAYQYFLSLLQKANVSGARGAMYEAVKAAQAL